MPTYRIESGLVNVSLAAGDGTGTVTFDHCYRKVPAVLVSFGETLGAGKRGFCSAGSITNTGFTITVDSDSALSDVDVHWLAMERRSSDWAALADT